MIINATHIGKKLDGIGRFSLYIARYFLGKYQVIINSKAKSHFSEKDLIKLRIVSPKISPDEGTKGHLKRLLFANTLRGKLFTLSQLEINLWNKKQIVVVHDLIPLLFPQYHKKQYYFYKYVLPFVLKQKVKLIVSVSFHTKELLVNYYNISENKIVVIYNGIVLPTKISTLSKEKENYILYVGRNSPTKNVSNLIKAFIKLKTMKRFRDLKLYLVGFKTKFERKDIISLGYVDDRKLDLLYRRAKVFFFPTLYEGFGYPVIEAMARGTAVLTSKVSSIPEICKDAALYIDNPQDIQEMVEKLKYILENDSFRFSLEQKGVSVAQEFEINKMLLKYDNLLSNCF